MNSDSIINKFRIPLKIIKICFYLAFVLLFIFTFFDATSLIFSKKSLINSNLFNEIFHLLIVFLCGFSLQSIEKNRCLTKRVTASIQGIGFILLIKAFCYYSLFQNVYVAIDFSFGPFRVGWIELLYACLLLFLSRLLHEFRLILR